jgi:hypothetical protein
MRRGKVTQGDNISLAQRDVPRREAPTEGLDTPA